MPLEVSQDLKGAGSDHPVLRCQRRPVQHGHCLRLADYLVSDGFGDLVLHPEHLDDYSEYADLGDGLLRLVLPREHLVELLQVVKI